MSSWLEQAAKGVPPAAQLELFETAWGALWRRAESAVGEIVLESIAEMVHSNSAERYPFLAPLELGTADISCKALLESTSPPEKSELQESLGFMLVNFLTVIGDLTDQILTPGLHDELSRLAPGAKIRQPAPQDKSRPESRMPLKKEQEEPPMPAKDKLMTVNDLITTGIHNLDTMLSGGLIKGSSTVIAGLPGSGKTILAQQIAFHNATPENQALYFSTLSEPGAKTLFYLNKFSYFDRKKMDQCIHFVDLGILLRTKGLAQTLEIIVERVKKIKPAFIVVDSFKVFEDMATSPEELRKFSYELVVNLMARRCTSLFLGEYTVKDLEHNPISAIIDGMISMTQRETSGEQQRFIQVVKMRGLAHSRDLHAFRITADGIEVFAPRLVLQYAGPMEPRP
ncbi:MAG: ATPase domain-containing protein, partial [Elusimicrobia bacterium]|nr:ATPase domain-containing protein [Elusimicrobiota bacterium]